MLLVHVRRARTQRHVPPRIVGWRSSRQRRGMAEERAQQAHVRLSASFLCAEKVEITNRFALKGALHAYVWVSRTARVLTGTFVQ